MVFFFFFQAEDGIRDLTVTGVQTCALPIWLAGNPAGGPSAGLAAELAAAAARHPDIGELVRAGFAARHALAQARLRRARDVEGLRAGIDAEVLIDQVAGPVWYRVLVTGAPVDRGY